MSHHVLSQQVVRGRASGPHPGCPRVLANGHLPVQKFEYMSSWSELQTLARIRSANCRLTAADVSALAFQGLEMLGLQHQSRTNSALKQLEPHIRQLCLSFEVGILMPDLSLD